MSPSSAAVSAPVEKEPRPDKVAAVAELTAKLKEYDNVFLADFTGLDVASTIELRRKFREADVEYAVVKNTLARRAVADAGLEAVEDLLRGPTAMAFGRSDSVAPARVLGEFREDHEKDLPIVKGGMVSGKFVTSEEVERLSKLPSRDQLLGQLAGVMIAPVSNFAGVMQGVLRGFGCALDQVRQQKESAGA